MKFKEQGYYTTTYISECGEYTAEVNRTNQEIIETNLPDALAEQFQKHLNEASTSGMSLEEILDSDAVFNSNSQSTSSPDSHPGDEQHVTTATAQAEIASGKDFSKEEYNQMSENMEEDKHKLDI